MKRVIILLLLSLFFKFNSFSLNANSQGKLEIHVVASATPDYISQWVTGPFEEDIRIKAVKEVVPEQTFYVSVIATGYGVDNDSNTNLVGDFILENPDGSIEFYETDMFSHKKPMKHRTGFVMLDPALDLTFEEEDPRGAFIIKARIKDNTSGKIVTGKYSVILKDKENK